MRRGLSVLIVDDHTLLGEMLAAELAANGCAAEAVNDPAEAVEVASRVQPDVAVLDIDLPGLTGFDVAADIASVSPGTKVLMLSAFVRNGYVDEALRMEVAGYLSKSEPLPTVLEAIDAVAIGDRRFSDAVRSRIVIGKSGAEERKTLTAMLTDRERTVLEHVAHGLSQKQVATAMGISIKTVQHHLSHVMDKVGIHDRVELSRYAIREGLIEP